MSSTLRSKPGAGSVFAVVAPLGASSPALAADARAPEPALAGEPLSGLRVLAIDNEPRVLDGMRVLLGKWGCRVAIARGLDDAREALAAFDGAPDAIIADYHLDEGDGLAVIAALREGVGVRRRRRFWPPPTAARRCARRPRAPTSRLLNKPLKPAPLRALLTRCLALRAAAE